MVGATGFEPATSWSQTKCSSQAELRSVRPGDEYPIIATFRNEKEHPTQSKVQSPESKVQGSVTLRPAVVTPSYRFVTPFVTGKIIKKPRKYALCNTVTGFSTWAYPSQECYRWPDGTLPICNFPFAI